MNTLGNFETKERAFVDNNRVSFNAFISLMKLNDI